MCRVLDSPSSVPIRLTAPPSNTQDIVDSIQFNPSIPMGLDVLEIGMGSDLSLDLRYFASKAV